MNTRRVVVGNDEGGRTTILSDGSAPAHYEFEHLPGQELTQLWFTSGPPMDTPPEHEPTAIPGPLIPTSGGVTAVIMQIAPESVAQSPTFDGRAAGKEYATVAVDIAGATDPDYPHLHRHRTLDIAVVLEGEIFLEVDDGQEVLLKPGDTLIQLVSRHTWHNRTAQPARIMTTSVAVAS